jgi:hypothetical protein
MARACQVCFSELAIVGARCDDCQQRRQVGTSGLDGPSIGPVPQGLLGEVSGEE